ncbi:N-acetyltransferase [uncultured Actinomyces sp.]|uniref:GNAT family N-acetyltransferase n=1 Tax=uncultured Actinomyces sp. TaxID=249061 RepID=UPI002635554C|nr:GNAT family N-acetyltransferase [uncultured Actinomyces sp.]
MAIKIVNEASKAVVDGMNKLLPQLSSSATAMNEQDVTHFLEQPATTLFVYTPDDDPDNILGMLTLVVFDIPTGTRAWVEDVVVAEETRGQGAGRQLVEAAVKYANKIGAKTVDLTSRPTREAANRLYRRVGFEQRETNVYRYYC